MHVDVLIVGAGLSGVGVACHLRRRSPARTFAILEARDTIGGTWDLFRYPGVRSDSDMFTLGYQFRPWTHPSAIADGATILEYVRDTAREHDIGRHVRYRHRVRSASWSSDSAQWTVVAAGPDGDVEYTCDFLFGCTGYYRYDAGYTPPLPGLDAYAGTVVHPQHWPDDLDWTGKRVVVVGSGATAVTLVPALAADAAHVTMLQRSPTWIGAQPSRDRTADRLRRLLPGRVAHPIVRWRKALGQVLLYQLSKRRPALVSRLLRKQHVALLPDGYDVDTHFTPSYPPWDQRLCVAPDGDLFRAVRHGTVSVLTDRIDTFTPNGIRLRSGSFLDADIVVTATGLELLALGGLTLTVDGQPVDIAETVAYKGTMLSGVPNFAMAVGYTNGSWTLKVDLAAGWVCRLLDRMRQRGERICVPVLPEGVARVPLFDLKSGYVARAAHMMPAQGDVAPWRLYQNYPRDVLMFRFGGLRDGALRFGRTAADLAQEIPDVHT